MKSLGSKSFDLVFNPASFLLIPAPLFMFSAIAFNPPAVGADEFMVLRPFGGKRDVLAMYVLQEKVKVDYPFVSYLVSQARMIQAAAKAFDGLGLESNSMLIRHKTCFRC
jgi:hypothetical protein